MTKKTLLVAGLMALTAGAQAQSGLLITGVMDGTLTGGEPKVLELYAISDVPDLSKYALSVAANGGATFSPITAEYIFPAVSLSAGSFYYAVGNSFTDQTGPFDTIFPGYSGIRSRNFGINSNGDDVEGLFYDATGLFAGSQVLVDVMGELGVDGTGTAWEHLDGWAYSNNGRMPSAIFNVADWYFSGNDVLDNLAPADIALSFPDQTYMVPEPSSLALMFLGGLAFVFRRRQ